GIRARNVTGVQTCALPIYPHKATYTGGIRFCLHFSSCDSPCRRMSTLHRCVDPRNSKFIFDSPEPLPIRATVTVPCGSATRSTRSEERRVGRERGARGDTG